MTTAVRFQIDAKLLRELGARLVGRPHIALAELIKNAYDADATIVNVTIIGDEMIVADNGHGMSEHDFVTRWMRIGTAQKESEQTSPGFGRPLTGSKGVGRLAAQLLGNSMRLESRTAAAPTAAVVAKVDWPTAIASELLNEATAELDVGDIPFELPGNSNHGTRVVMSGLQQVWDVRAIRELALEIWPLRPPFKTDARGEGRGDFTVTLRTGVEAQETAFEQQMDAVLNLWTVRMVGRTLDAGHRDPDDVVVIPRPSATMPPPDTDGAGVTDVDEDGLDLQAPPPADVPGYPRTVQLTLHHADGSRETVHYRLDDSNLDRFRFEIRVFNLKNRQASGVPVGDARAYLRRFGGVHVYDAGFHLPYYGPDADWLHVEMDHSHRLSRSALLPQSLTRGNEAANPMQQLPTNSRLFGVVWVDTSKEQRFARSIGPAATREALSIQVTRDRLADNQAYRSLVRLTRFALDFYAIREAQRAWQAKQNKLANKKPGNDGGGEADPAGELATVKDRTAALRDIVANAGSDLPPAVVQSIDSELDEVDAAVDREREFGQARIGLLGALATAGITTLAYEHEAAKQNALLTVLVSRLRRENLSREDIDSIADAIDSVLARAAATRRLFSHLLDERSRDSTGTFQAAALARSVADQVRPLLRNVPVDISGVPTTLRLPDGGYAEWTAVLQNLYINAANAMLDSDRPAIDVDGGTSGKTSWLRVQDTGVGVDVADAERLFLPFERDARISEDRRALGLGGTGLGLTIVRMLVTDAGASIAFEIPDDRHSTAVVLRWPAVR